MPNDMSGADEQSVSPLWKQLEENFMTSTKPFSFDTIDNFDDHIAKSIPNYHLLADSIRDLSTFFVKEDYSVVDLGCSTGALLESIPFEGDKLGIDISSNLLPESHDNVQFVRKDLRSIHNFGKTPSLILSIFTLQFLPLGDRQTILNLVYEELAEGGGFVWAEKCHEEDGELENVFNFAYYDFKNKHFTSNEIMSKERDLRPLMKTKTAEENIAMAVEAGFDKGACFWKFYNFEAWLFIK
jgi:tRNA (cmo5U34)-methyltransferase